MNDSAPKLHHILPIRYQSGFAIPDGCVWYFDRRRGTIACEHPKRVAAESHFFLLLCSRAFLHSEASAQKFLAMRLFHSQNFTLIWNSLMAFVERRVEALSSRLNRKIIYFVKWDILAWRPENTYLPLIPTLCIHHPTNRLLPLITLLFLSKW